MGESAPLVRCAADLVGLGSLRVQVTGTYGVEELHKHAMLVEDASGRTSYARRVAYIQLRDNTFVSLQVRPSAEMDRLDGCEVVVIGTLLAPDSDGLHEARADPQPTLVDIDQVAPA